MTVKLSASILSADLAALGAQCRAALAAGADLLHVDVMDGHFVPNISYGPPVLECLHRALPQAFYDVHMMVSEPGRYAAPLAAAGASLLTFHLEAAAGREQATIDAIRAAGCRVGATLRPGTPIEALWPWLDQLDLVLVMSVEPGFGGQRFQPQALARIAAVRAECDRRGLAPYLEVDGGVDPVTAPQCVAAGANLLVAGSALFAAPDMAAAARAIKQGG